MENTSMREALDAARDLLLPQCNGGTAFAKACGETVNKIMDALKEDRTSDGNAAAIREALLIVKRLFDGRLMWQPDIRKAHEAVNAALAHPPRNCDVGTSEEQARRFNSFCKTHLSGISGMCSPQCPCIWCRDMCHCLTKWSQMPY